MDPAAGQAEDGVTGSTLLSVDQASASTTATQKPASS